MEPGEKNGLAAGAEQDASAKPQEEAAGRGGQDEKRRRIPALLLALPVLGNAAGLAAAALVWFLARNAVVAIGLAALPVCASCAAAAFAAKKYMAERKYDK